MSVTAQNIFDKLFSPGLYDILIIVLAHSTPASLFNLAKTSRLYCTALLPLFPYLWDINRHLRQFFSDPVGFRSLQARTATLISGSSALQFLDRSFYDGSDLDLYVYNESMKEVCEWIMQREGYVFAPKVRQDREFEVALDSRPSSLYRMRGVRNIIDLEHPDGRKIQVISAESTPMQIILHFHSTCVMNVISYSYAYSLYPTATFEHRTSLICASEGPSHAPAQQKYRERGWTLLPALPASSLASAFSPTTPPRWLADRLTWTLPLDTTGISPPAHAHQAVPLLTDPVLMTSWRLRPTGVTILDDPEVEMSCKVLNGVYRHCKYAYVLTDKGFWMNFCFWYPHRVFPQTHGDPDLLPKVLYFDGAVVPVFTAYQRALTDAIYSSARSIDRTAEAAFLSLPVTDAALADVMHEGRQCMESAILELKKEAQKTVVEALGEYQENFIAYCALAGKTWP